MPASAPREIPDLLEAFCQQHQLTKREAEIIHLLVRKITTAEGLAVRLKVSKNTVRIHLQNLLSKTQNSSKTELMADIVQFIIAGN